VKSAEECSAVQGDGGGYAVQRIREVNRYGWESAKETGRPGPWLGVADGSGDVAAARMSRSWQVTHAGALASWQSDGNLVT
jgi:hypothetical protein